MKHRPLKIDWDALDEAFNDSNEELVYYLDLVDGHVLLEGEGEEDLDEDEDGSYEAAASPAPARNDATRLYVVPPRTPEKLGWMRSFVDEQGAELGPEVVSALEDGMLSDDPPAAIGEVLRENPAVRDRWFLFRSDRVHGVIERWLDDNGVVPADPAPWKA